MSERTQQLAAAADTAAQEWIRLYSEWQGASKLAARLRAAARPLAAWAAAELAALLEQMWDDADAAMRLKQKTMQDYLTASEQERPYLAEQAAARAAEKAAAS